MCARARVRRVAMLLVSLHYLVGGGGVKSCEVASAASTADWNGK